MGLPYMSDYLLLAAYEILHRVRILDTLVWTRKKLMEQG
jgi:hypothetical protein